jgi:hypothetical protein
MRALMDMQGGSGVNLVQKLFSARDSRYIDRLRLPEDEVNGLKNIYEGSFAAFRNRAAHTVAGYTRDEARGIIQLVNLLLMKVDQMRYAPEQEAQPAIEEALDPGATQRLQRFLGRILEIGLTTEEGLTAVGYKAKLLYKYPTWPEHRPHAITVFYLETEREPALRFRIDMLSRVKDLDVEKLQTRLLNAGCTSTTRKTTPVELVLTRRNDQATLDRIFNILQDLIRQHGLT